MANGEVELDSELGLAEATETDEIIPETPALRSVPKASDLLITDPIVDTDGIEYKTGGHIGRGGFSDVIFVESTNPIRYRAMKVLAPEIQFSEEADAKESAQRFLQEAEILREMPDHPNIVQACSRNAFMFNGRTAFLLEYLPINLKQLLRNYPNMTVRQKLDICIQIADAICHVHENQIIHRDIKPTNILFSREDITTPKLADFGVAKKLDHSRIDTGKGTLAGLASVQQYAMTEPQGVLLKYFMGTFKYAAPELFAPQKFHSYALDIFSFGALMYWLFTNKYVFVEHKINDNTIKALSETVKLEPTLADDLKEIRTAIKEYLARKFGSKAREVVDKIPEFQLPLVVKAPGKQIFYRYQFDHPALKPTAISGVSLDIGEALEYMLHPDPKRRFSATEIRDLLVRIRERDYA